MKAVVRNAETDAGTGVRWVRRATCSHRDLSWLEFNRRVLEEATDRSVPLLERAEVSLRLPSTNLDEFSWCRGGLQQLLNEGRNVFDPAGMTNPRATYRDQAGARMNLCGKAIRVFLAGH